MQVTSPPKEKAVLLGPRRSLVGIVTPAAGSANASPVLPAIVILNSGIIHRVGANRLSVLLARSVAAAGFAAIRFDLSGIGDSEPRGDATTPLDAAMADIKEALDSVAKIAGDGRFILVGLCSGADHSVIYAGTDPRIVGIAILDPSIPRTPGYFLRHYGLRLLRGASWLNIILGRHPEIRALRKRMAGDQVSTKADGPSLESPEVRAFLARAYGSAISAGVRILAVLTTGSERQHNYAGQIKDAFPSVRFGERLRTEYLRGVDHTFMSERSRARVTRLIIEWAGSVQGSSRAAPPVPELRQPPKRQQ